MRIWRTSLLVAGIHDCGLAAYHFVLPHHMQWRRGLEGVADSLVWALFALNFSWSLLLFLVGCLVIDAARRGPRAGPFARRTIFTVGLFWMVHGLYTWANPFPLPVSLQWLGVVFGVFPVIVVILHWLPLVVAWAGDRAEVSRAMAGTT